MTALEEQRETFAREFLNSAVRQVLDRLERDPAFTDYASDIGDYLEMTDANGRIVDGITYDINQMLVMAVAYTMRQWMFSGLSHYNLNRDLKLPETLEKMSVAELGEDTDTQTIITSIPPSYRAAKTGSNATEEADF